MHTCNCATCYVSFSIPAAMERRLRECHNTFYCPSGHANFYPAKSDLEITKQKLSQKEREIESLLAAQKKATKLATKPVRKASKKAK